MPEQSYDPLSLPSLGEGVVRELVNRSLHRLPPEETFTGCGLYALYYEGDFEPYRPLAERTDPEEGQYRVPIYVGKAVPAGTRKGRGFLELEVSEDTSLYRRLREHARSIEEANNLDIDDFRCRYLVTAPIWIRLAESLMLGRYRPLWNSLIDGFGNHDPGSGRYNQECSRWDTLHPGRPWADKLKPPTSCSHESLARDVREFLEEHVPELAQDGGEN